MVVRAIRGFLAVHEGFMLKIIMGMVVLFLLNTSVALASQDTQLSFSVYGKQVSQLEFTKLSKIIRPQKIKVWEPHEKKEVTYEAIPVDKLLDYIYGSSWQKKEEVLFTCSDGYQPSLSVQRFKKYKSYLAFRRTDQKTFSLQDRLHNNKTVNLGPLYLVWDNMHSQELKSLGANGWPYQVVGIDLVRFTDKLPKISPPPKSSTQVKNGFLKFRNHCLVCHSINGEGGNKGPDLNYPVNVTEYITKDWLKRFIINTSSIRYNTQMPNFKNIPAVRDHIDDILEYLKAMKKKKIQPVKG